MLTFSEAVLIRLHQDGLVDGRWRTRRKGGIMEGGIHGWWNEGKRDDRKKGR